jgi:hypothetical protein
VTWKAGAHEREWVDGRAVHICNGSHGCCRVLDLEDGVKYDKN